MRKFVIFSFTIMCLLAASATKSWAGDSDGYSIKGNVKGIKDTVCILAYHFGDQKRVADSADIDSKGNFEFKGEEKLIGGIYMIALPTPQGHQLVEILMGKEQHFSVSMDTTDLVGSVKFKGSKLNEIYYQHLRDDAPIRKDVAELTKKFEAEKDEKKKEAQRQAIIALNKKLEDNRARIIKENKDLFLADLFTWTTDVEIPEAPKDTDGNPIDTLWGFKYRQQHYFDNFNFGDERMLRTPFYFSKIDFYLDNMNYQIPDSLNKAIDKIMKPASKDSNMYKFTIDHIRLKYGKSKRMGNDAILSHIFENYYKDGKAWWIDEKFTKDIEEYIILHKYNQIGMKAPPLIVRDTAGVFHDLSRLKDEHILVLFWSATCGHCKKTVPYVHDSIYVDYKDKGFEVFSVCIDKDDKPLKKFLQKHNLTWINGWGPDNENSYRTYWNVRKTPVMYYLNKEHIIEYKEFDEHALEMILEDKIE